jgi:hypothetical protein
MTSDKISPKGTRIAKFSGSFTATGAEKETYGAHTIQGINMLPPDEKRLIYSRVVPPELIEFLRKECGSVIDSNLRDEQGRDLLWLRCPPNSTFVEMKLYQNADTYVQGERDKCGPGGEFADPVLYGQITDTVTGQLYILLYIVNDPTSPRFNVDCMPDGQSTRFGTECRNLEAEEAAMRYGLAPGQVRRGLRMLGEAIKTFEGFVASLGQEMYFAEPLYYHNAILFERYGFSYAKGRRLMERIHQGFAEGGDLRLKLDGSTPFRSPEAASSIRLRSWAIHDGLLGEPFTDVTMYRNLKSVAPTGAEDPVPW